MAWEVERNDSRRDVGGDRNSGRIALVDCVVDGGDKLVMMTVSGIYQRMARTGERKLERDLGEENANDTRSPGRRSGRKRELEGLVGGGGGCPSYSTRQPGQAQLRGMEQRTLICIPFGQAQTLVTMAMDVSARNYAGRLSSLALVDEEAKMIEADGGGV